MKKTILIIMAAFMGCFSFAQSTIPLNNSFICSYYGEPVNIPLKGFASSAEARNVINGIIDVIGLEPTFEIRSANIPNAAAVISSGKRFIFYNPRFIAAINHAAKDQWASIAILAHEIGHHLNGHTLLGSGSRPSIELEADQFSGFVLRKMGASLSQAQLAMQLVANEKASSTHPARISRMVSIENGWSKANAQINGTQHIAKSIPSGPLRPASVKQAYPVTNRSYVLDPRYIKFDVLINADKTHLYYITSANNFVTVSQAQLLILGKVISVRNAAFPLTIQVEGQNKFFISNRGVILTSNGQEVGYLKKPPKV